MISSPIPLRHWPGFDRSVAHLSGDHGHHLLVALGTHQLALHRARWEQVRDGGGGGGDGGGGGGGDGDGAGGVLRSRWVRW